MMMSSVALIRGASRGSGCAMASGTATMEGTRQRDSAQVSHMICMVKSSESHDMHDKVMWNVVKQVDMYEE